MLGLGVMWVDEWVVFLVVALQDAVLFLSIILFGIFIWLGNWWFIIPMIFGVYLIRQFDRWVTLELNRRGFK